MYENLLRSGNCEDLQLISSESSKGTAGWIWHNSTPRKAITITSRDNAFQESDSEAISRGCEFHYLVNFRRFLTSFLTWWSQISGTAKENRRNFSAVGVNATNSKPWRSETSQTKNGSAMHTCATHVLSVFKSFSWLLEYFPLCQTDCSEIDQWEYLRKLERNFPIKLGQPIEMALFILNSFSIFPN